MDERYRAIYAAIYVNRTGDRTVPPFRELGFPQRRRGPDQDARVGLRDAVEAAERSSGTRLREDAKALLVVNFQDLVLYPLVVGGRWDRGEVLGSVSSDIRMLTADAAERSASREEAGISGHTIIDSLSSRWPDLQTSGFRLWEGTND